MGRRYMMALALSGASLVLLWSACSRQDATPLQVEDPAQSSYYDERDWASERQGKLNISVFTFRDANRNGRYDLGDSPMAAVAVRLERPDGKPSTRRSNINGFTNFSMSLDAKSAQVNRPGDNYVFEAQVPDGWRLTTGNKRQQTRFIVWPGSIAGLVADPPPAVVGLAPELTLAGRLQLPTAVAPATLELSSVAPDGVRTRRQFAPDGQFSFAAGPGLWRLELLDPDSGELLVRSVEVRGSPVVLSALAPGEPVAILPGVPVLQDFEYQQRSEIDKIPMGQSGLGWDYLLAVDNQTYRGPGYVNGLISGKMVGYNSSGHPASVLPAEAGQRFDFVGAFFTAAWASAEGELLSIRAWRGDQLVGDEVIALSHLGPVWFQGDYLQIDRLELSTAHYSQFVTDDMHFRLPATPPLAARVYFPDIPDLDQVQPGQGLAGDGSLLCAPVAVSNSLVWLEGNSDPAYQLELVNKLAGPAYMRTNPHGGTGVMGLMRGVDRYITETRGTYKRLEYAGWRTLQGYSRVGSHPTPGWLGGGLHRRGAVWLNIGWYRAQDGDWVRRGGHWVTLAGFGDGGGLIIHDPGPWADSAGKGQLVGLAELTTGRLLGNNSGLPVSARGYFSLDLIMPADQSDSVAVLDGAVLLELEDR